MIKYLLDVKSTVESWLIHSVKVPDDLLFKEEFLRWAKNPLFHYIPTFTRWSHVDYHGETGRIGGELLRKHIPLDRGLFFLCGPKSFVTDMEHDLISLQVLPERIRREQW
jgi:ferredoxin-NADP reductase